MNGASGLERGYRRLVASYPPSFRRENGDEILTVLLATAREGQRRPGIAESAALIKGALLMRLGLSRTPRTVLYAVRLMYLGAIAELGLVITLALSEGSIRAAIIRRNPGVTMAELQPLNRLFIAEIAGCCVVIAVWLLMAWASGKGYGLARVLAIVLFAISTVGMIVDAAAGTGLYAPAALIAAAVVWLIGLGALVLLLRTQSGPHFARQVSR